MLFQKLVYECVVRRRLAHPLLDFLDPQLQLLQPGDLLLQNPLRVVG
jgi:hypothetical protein